MCIYFDLVPSISCLFVSYHTHYPAIYTLSLHDALPISGLCWNTKYHGFLPLAIAGLWLILRALGGERPAFRGFAIDRKSTRLISSHRCISYAVFCLKKKKCCTMTHECHWI